MSALPKIVHPVRTVTALTPDYVADFRCTGPDCRDNCCTGWRVTIDKASYQTYRKLDRQGFPVRLVDHLQKATPGTQAHYASIRLVDGSHACPLMDDGWCTLQKHGGEDLLSDTCFSYPRATRRIGNRWEQALSLSCPEAARLALARPDTLTFIGTELRVRQAAAAAAALPAEAAGFPAEVADEARTFCFGLMQTTDLPLWQRLVLLGLFCQLLTEAAQSGRPEQVAAGIAATTELVASGNIGREFADIAADRRNQARLYGQLWSTKNVRVASALQNRVTESIWRGLTQGDGRSQVHLDDMAAAYAQGLQGLPAGLADTPFLFDNHLLNDMFRENFPFGMTTPYAHYLALVARHGIVRFMLAVQANDPQADRPGPVDTVQVFCRRFQHDAEFARKVNQVLGGSPIGQLHHLVRLIRP